MKCIKVQILLFHLLNELLTFLQVYFFIDGIVELLSVGRGRWGVITSKTRGKALPGPSKAAWQNIVLLNF
jgi:hypothetical protein